MSNAIHEELSQLASKFTENRLLGKKHSFPDELWKAAIAITDKLPIAMVCQAIKITPAYLRKKMSDLASINTKEPLTFLEITQRASTPLNTITINVESSCGHRLKIDGASTSCLIPLISQFLKEGTSCCK